MLLLVRWRLQVKQADGREILQVGAYAAKVDPLCGDLGSQLGILVRSVTHSPLTPAWLTQLNHLISLTLSAARMHNTTLPMMSTRTPLPPPTHREC